MSKQCHSNLDQNKCYTASIETLSTHTLSSSSITPSQYPHSFIPHSPLPSSLSHLYSSSTPFLHLYPPSLSLSFSISSLIYSSFSRPLFLSHLYLFLPLPFFISIPSHFHLLSSSLFVISHFSSTSPFFSPIIPPFITLPPSLTIFSHPPSPFLSNPIPLFPLPFLLLYVTSSLAILLSTQCLIPSLPKSGIPLLSLSPLYFNICTPLLY